VLIPSVQSILAADVDSNLVGLQMEKHRYCGEICMFFTQMRITFCVGTQSAM
jgi:hypothetical protein